MLSQMLCGIAGKPVLRQLHIDCLGVQIDYTCRRFNHQWSQVSEIVDVMVFRIIQHDMLLVPTFVALVHMKAVDLPFTSV